MLKNRTIRTKLIIGIGLMILIITAVVAYTIYNLQDEKVASVELKENYLEALQISSDLNQSINDVMYNMRAYGLSGIDEYYNKGIEKMQEAENHMLSLESFLEDYPSEARESYFNMIQTAHDNYYDAIYATHESKNKIEKAQEDLSASAGEFMSQARAYYDDQVLKNRSEITAGNTPENLLNRNTKVEKITGILNDAMSIRLGIAKGIIGTDAVAIHNQEVNIEKIKSQIDEIETVTTDDYNLQQLEAIKSALDDYNAKMSILAAEFENQDRLAETRAASGNNFQEATNQLAADGMSDIKAQALNTIDSVTLTTSILLYGFIFAVLVGVIFNFIIVKRIIKSIKEVTEVAKTLSTGDVDVVIEASSNDEIGEMIGAFNVMIDNTRNQAEVARLIATGDNHIDIQVQSEKDVLNLNLQEAVNSLNRLLSETDKLTDGIRKGNLKVRAEEGVLKGVWDELLTGINELIDAFVNPINLTNEYITDIGNGIVPPKMDQEYYGDFNEIKVSINKCIDGLEGLVEDTSILIKKSKDGDLGFRADTSKHRGQYKEIIKGINETLDAVIEPVTEASDVLSEMSKGNLNVKVSGNYNGDHNKIKNALNTTIEFLRLYITEIASVLGKMGDGDFSTNVSVDFKGDFIKIKKAFDNILSSLNSVLGEINIAAEQVSTGSNQVSASSQALSQGSTEQASAVEEITASITEVAEQTKENALNANKANDISEKAKVGAVTGNNKMEEMVVAMKEINDSSNNISKIIKVIDEIAFQTNILALNAAVEAARAGEHGKGFAVVAEEVRNLAARSANAAKETTALIENSISKVESGTEIANETAKSLNEIVEGVTTVAEIVSTIASASNEQAIAISQISEGVNQISDVTQNNTATAEETAAASEQMSAQSDLLKEMISKFKLIDKYAQKIEATIEEEPEKNYPATPEKMIHLDDLDFGKY